MSFTIVCPECGEAWARVEGTLQGWFHVSGHCPDHPTEYHIGGTLFPISGLLWYDIFTFMKTYPEAAKHEFEAHLKWAERFGK